MSERRSMDDRGVSEVIGFVLAFAMILAAVIFVSTSGLSGLDDVRAAEQVDNAERAFDVIAENLADVYRQGAPSRATEIDLARATLSFEDPIVMNVTNGSSVITQQEITPIVYGGEGEERIVYAGGAVFRTRDQAGVVLRQPPISVSDDGVHLTIVGTRSRGADSVAGGTIRLGAERSSTDLSAYDTEGTHGTLWLNVTSPRWQAWESALEGDQVSCLSGAATPTDVVACEIYPGGTPDRVAVSFVRIDVSLST